MLADDLGIALLVLGDNVLVILIEASQEANLVQLVDVAHL